MLRGRLIQPAWWSAHSSPATAGLHDLILGAPNVRITQGIYLNYVPEKHLVPCMNFTLKKNRTCSSINQRELTKTVHVWRKKRFCIISAEECPPYIPDVNPPDCSIWGGSLSTPYRTVSRMHRQRRREIQQIRVVSPKYVVSHLKTNCANIFRRKQIA